MARYTCVRCGRAIGENERHQQCSECTRHFHLGCSCVTHPNARMNIIDPSEPGRTETLPPPRRRGKKWGWLAILAILLAILNCLVLSTIFGLIPQTPSSRTTTAQAQSILATQAQATVVAQNETATAHAETEATTQAQAAIAAAQAKTATSQAAVATAQAATAAAIAEIETNTQSRPATATKQAEIAAATAQAATVMAIQAEEQAEKQFKATITAQAATATAEVKATAQAASTAQAVTAAAEVRRATAQAATATAQARAAAIATAEIRRATAQAVTATARARATDQAVAATAQARRAATSSARMTATAVARQAAADDEVQIRQVISEFDGVKKDAVGRFYDDSQLTTVLRGQALEEQQGSVKWLRTCDAYYDITLHNLSIESYSVTSSTYIIVTVYKEESRTYHRGNSSQTIAHDKYRISYDLQKIGGKWYIVRKGVIDENTGHTPTPMPRTSEINCG